MGVLTRSGGGLVAAQGRNLHDIGRPFPEPMALLVPTADVWTGQRTGPCTSQRNRSPGQRRCHLFPHGIGVGRLPSVRIVLVAASRVEDVVSSARHVTADCPLGHPSPTQNSAASLHETGLRPGGHFRIIEAIVGLGAWRTPPLRLCHAFQASGRYSAALLAVL